MQNEDGCFNFLGWQIVCVPGNLFTKKKENKLGMKSKTDISKIMTNK